MSNNTMVGMVKDHIRQRLCRFFSMWRVTPQLAPRNADSDGLASPLTELVKQILPEIVSEVRNENTVELLVQEHSLLPEARLVAGEIGHRNRATYEAATPHDLLISIRHDRWPKP
jgi:hypothetical protein